MSRYPLVPLGEVMTLARDEVAVGPEQTYRIAGIYSFGRGLFSRPAIEGTETKYKSLYRLHEGQFVLSRLKGWEGAVGVVGAEFDGAFVSQEFPTFNINASKATPDYLNWVCRWQPFWESLQDRSKGVGARRERVHPDRLLATKIPLPPIEDQRRMVNYLDAAMNRANLATRLVDRCKELTSALAGALVTSEAPLVRLGSLITRVKRAERVEPDNSYVLLGIRWYGEGLFKKGRAPGNEIKATTLYRVANGDFVYSRLFAWKGSFALASNQHGGCYVSGEFPTYEIDKSAIEPEYLLAVARRPTMWEDALGESSGSTPTSRNRLKEERLLAMPVPVPPRAEQERVVRANRMVDGVAEIGGRRRELLDALQPALINSMLV